MSGSLRLLALAGVALVASVQARAADAPSFAGVYVGHPTVVQGSCITGPRLMSVVVNSRGEARLLYGLSSGVQLEGAVDPDGTITMKTPSDTLTLLFEGVIQGQHLSGVSGYNDNRTCDLSWEMDRQPE